MKPGTVYAVKGNRVSRRTPYSRRHFAKVALAALPLPLAAAKIDSILHGVHVGLHTYSFSEIPAENALETIIHFMAETGIGECILWAPHIEPRNLWDVLRPPQGSVRPSAAAQADPRIQVSAQHRSRDHP